MCSGSCYAFVMLCCSDVQCLKNANTLASCSFDKHGLILIILGKQHQHTFKNDVRVQVSVSLYFYLLYLLLNSCDGNDAKHNGINAFSSVDCWWL